MSTLIYTACAIVTGLTLSYRIYRGSIIHQLRSQDDGLVFSRTTNSLTTIDVTLVIFMLVAQNIQNILGVGKKRQVSKQHALSKKDKAKKDDVSIARVWVTMLLDIKEVDIRQYLLAAGISKSSGGQPIVDHIKDNNVHLGLFLSALSNPALLLLLARTKCPIDPLGAVNVRNRVRIIDRQLCCQILDASSNLDDSANTKYGPRQPIVVVHACPLVQTRQVKRGREVDVKVTIRYSSDTTEDGYVEIFEQIFTVLEFGKSKSSDLNQNRPGSSKTSDVKRKSGLMDVPNKELKTPPQLASYFRISSNDPLQWARLCSDYNPIHVSTLAAKVFGFRSKIAHGNHVVAKAVTMLTKAGEKSFTSFVRPQEAEEMWMEVEFRRPVLLPSEVGVRNISETSITDKVNEQRSLFQVFKDEKVHVDLDFSLRQRG